MVAWCGSDSAPAGGLRTRVEESWRASQAQKMAQVRRGGARAAATPLWPGQALPQTGLATVSECQLLGSRFQIPASGIRYPASGIRLHGLRYFTPTSWFAAGWLVIFPTTGSQTIFSPLRKAMLPRCATVETWWPISTSSTGFCRDFARSRKLRTCAGLASPLERTFFGSRLA